MVLQYYISTILRCYTNTIKIKRVFALDIAHKKISFPLRISSNTDLVTFHADSVTFTEIILNGKLCTVRVLKISPFPQLVAKYYRRDIIIEYCYFCYNLTFHKVW